MPLVGDIANSTLSGRLKFLRALPKGGALKIYKKILSKNISDKIPLDKSASI